MTRVLISEIAIFKALSQTLEFLISVFSRLLAIWLCPKIHFFVSKIHYWGSFMTLWLHQKYCLVNVSHFKTLSQTVELMS